MKKRKNYLRMFLSYCTKNEIWFSVYGDGGIDECADTDDGWDFWPDNHLKLGSKAAYEWLVKTHREHVKEIRA